MTEPLPEWMRDPFAVLARGRHLLDDPAEMFRRPMKGGAMTERDLVELLNTLGAIKESLRELVAEVHGLGKDTLLVREAMNNLAKVIHDDWHSGGGKS